MGKTKKILTTLTFNPWAFLATWLPIGAPNTELGIFALGV
jgi:hypothetical protein